MFNGPLPPFSSASEALIRLRLLCTASTIDCICAACPVLAQLQAERWFLQDISELQLLLHLSTTEYLPGSPEHVTWLAAVRPRCTEYSAWAALRAAQPLLLVLASEAPFQAAAPRHVAGFKRPRLAMSRRKKCSRHVSAESLATAFLLDSPGLSGVCRALANYQQFWQDRMSPQECASSFELFKARAL